MNKIESIQSSLFDVENSETDEFIMCKICRRVFIGSLLVHLHKYHKITSEEYMHIFPGSRLYTKKFLLHQKYAFDCLMKKDPDHQKKAFAKLLEKNPNHQCEVGKIGGHNSQETLKRENKGFYGMSFEFHQEIGRKNGIASQKIHKEKGTGFYDVEVKRKGGKATYKKYGVEYYRELGKKAHQTNLKRGFSVGKVRVQQMINETPYKYEGKKFLSKEELKCYKIIRQIFKSEEIIVNGFIGNKSVDFHILLISLFIEYHPYTLSQGLSTSLETKEEYYQRRRKLLDDSEYKEHKLIVFSNLKEVKEWIQSLKK